MAVQATCLGVDVSEGTGSDTRGPVDGNLMYVLSPLVY